jgi:hypothetical protein
MEATNYKILPDAELIEEYCSSLQEYKKWIEKKYKLNADWDSEVFYMMSTRDDFHSIVTEIKMRNLKHSDKKLRGLDQVWQNWLASNSDPEYKLLSLQNKPKDHWWWWVDQLDTLSDDQRNTI